MIGRNPSLVADIMSGRAETPTERTYLRLATVMGVEVDVLHNPALPEPQFGGGSGDGPRRTEPPAANLIPLVKVVERFEADSDYLVLKDEGWAPFGIDERILKRLRVRAQDVRVFRATRSQDDGQIIKGDYVLIDVSQKETTAPGVYMFFRDWEIDESPGYDMAIKPELYGGRPKETEGRVLYIFRVLA